VTGSSGNRQYSNVRPRLASATLRASEISCFVWPAPWPAMTSIIASITSSDALRSFASSASF